MTHASPYTSNHDPLDVRDYYINDSEYSLDAMGVDLFLNGHDHIYIRSTVKNDIKGQHRRRHDLSDRRYGRQ